jgi:hypothetical protein
MVVSGVVEKMEKSIAAWVMRTHFSLLTAKALATSIQ